MLLSTYSFVAVVITAMLYTALTTIEEWAYVAATCGILALLYLTLHPALRNSHQVERSLLCGFIFSKLSWFILLIVELARVLDSASFIQALRLTYLGSYLHDTLTIV